MTAKPQFQPRIAAIFDAELEKARTARPTAAQLGKELQGWEKIWSDRVADGRVDGATFRPLLADTRALLKRYDALAAPAQLLVAAAVRYVVREDDGLVDGDRFLGLEDDAEVVEAVTACLP